MKKILTLVVAALAVAAVVWWNQRPGSQDLPSLVETNPLKVEKVAAQPASRQYVAPTARSEREEWAARELMASLDDAKRGEVIFQRNALTRHVTWNEPYVKPLESVGVPLSALNNDQQALALEVIAAWMGTQAEPVAKAHLDRINSAGLDAIRFGWAGALEERRPHYYRLQGSSFLMEYDNTRSGAVHIHSVWRVFDEDFGQGLV
ncbi:MAG: DUF3500 domain-containing protein [Anaerolineae bacterium]|nr:DUF3500 domain-containing protein [Anaerolineae bacterium]